ncbi:secB [Symbiodinium pilosum]|uniref:SecB protein n=1 Tax=Symbiodinium pilosum TaxID=2952 RepID=A0A812S0K7_SYMPI|nr:secB [Symbiodinium pilosum]
MSRGGAAVSAQELVQLVNNEGAVVVDLRDKAEFEAGHIVDAINIPFAAIETRMDELNPHKGKPMVLVCKMGQHAGSAGTQLRKAGFEQVSRLRGGIADWRAQNLPVDINTTVNNLGDNRHEVVLAVTVTSKRDGDRVAFVAEVHYAGIFVINGLDAQQLHQVIGIACPNTLFPYVRENLDSLVVRGGFPAMQLAQVNFEALYAQAMQKANKKDDAPVQH